MHLVHTTEASGPRRETPLVNEEPCPISRPSQEELEGLLKTNGVPEGLSALAKLRKKCVPSIISALTLKSVAPAYIWEQALGELTHSRNHSGKSPLAQASSYEWREEGMGLSIQRSCRCRQDGSFHITGSCGEQLVDVGFAG